MARRRRRASGEVGGTPAAASAAPTPSSPTRTGLALPPALEPWTVQVTLSALAFLLLVTAVHFTTTHGSTPNRVLPAAGGAGALLMTAAARLHRRLNTAPLFTVLLSITVFLSIALGYFLPAAINYVCGADRTSDADFATPLRTPCLPRLLPLERCGVCSIALAWLCPLMAVVLPFGVASVVSSEAGWLTQKRFQLPPLLRRALFLIVFLFITLTPALTQHAITDTRGADCAHVGAGLETPLRTPCLPRLPLLERCGVSSAYLARMVSLTAVVFRLGAAFAACAAALLAVMLIADSCLRYITVPSLFSLSNPVVMPAASPLLEHPAAWLRSSAMDFLDLCAAVLDHLGFYPRPLRSHPPWLLLPTPSDIPPRATFTHTEAVAPTQRRPRGKRGGQGKHVALRTVTRDLGRLARFDANVATMTDDKEKDVDDADDYDGDCDHPYFREVLSCELAGYGFGYTDDECDDDGDEAALSDELHTLVTPRGVSGL